MVAADTSIVASRDILKILNPSKFEDLVSLLGSIRKKEAIPDIHSISREFIRNMIIKLSNALNVSAKYLCELSLKIDIFPNDEQDAAKKLLELYYEERLSLMEIIHIILKINSHPDHVYYNDSQAWIQQILDSKHQIYSGLLTIIQYNFSVANLDFRHLPSLASIAFNLKLEENHLASKLLIILNKFHIAIDIRNYKELLNLYDKVPKWDEGSSLMLLCALLSPLEVCSRSKKHLNEITYLHQYFVSLPKILSFGSIMNFIIKKENKDYDNEEEKEKEREKKRIEKGNANSNERDYSPLLHIIIDKSFRLPSPLSIDQPFEIISDLCANGVFVDIKKTIGGIIHKILENDSRDSCLEIIYNLLISFSSKFELEPLPYFDSFVDSFRIIFKYSSKILELFWGEDYEIPEKSAIIDASIKLFPQSTSILYPLILSLIHENCIDNDNSNLNIKRLEGEEEKSMNKLASDRTREILNILSMSEIMTVKDETGYAQEFYFSSSNTKAESTMIKLDHSIIINPLNLPIMLERETVGILTICPDGTAIIMWKCNFSILNFSLRKLSKDIENGSLTMESHLFMEFLIGIMEAFSNISHSSPSNITVMNIINEQFKLGNSIFLYHPTRYENLYELIIFGLETELQSTNSISKCIKLATLIGSVDQCLAFIQKLFTFNEFERIIRHAKGERYLLNDCNINKDDKNGNDNVAINVYSGEYNIDNIGNSDHFDNNSCLFYSRTSLVDSILHLLQKALGIIENSIEKDEMEIMNNSTNNTSMTDKDLLDYPNSSDMIIAPFDEIVVFLEQVQIQILTGIDLNCLKSISAFQRHVSLSLFLIKMGKLKSFPPDLYWLILGNLIDLKNELKSSISRSYSEFTRQGLLKESIILISKVVELSLSFNESRFIKGENQNEKEPINEANEIITCNNINVDIVKTKNSISLASFFLEPSKKCKNKTVLQEVLEGIILIHHEDVALLSAIANIPNLQMSFESIKRFLDLIQKIIERNALTPGLVNLLRILLLNYQNFIPPNHIFSWLQSIVAFFSFSFPSQEFPNENIFNQFFRLVLSLLEDLIRFKNIDFILGYIINSNIWIPLFKQFNKMITIWNDCSKNETENQKRKRKYYLDNIRLILRFLILLLSLSILNESSSIIMPVQLVEGIKILDFNAIIELLMADWNLIGNSLSCCLISLLKNDGIFNLIISKISSLIMKIIKSLSPQSIFINIGKNDSDGNKFLISISNLQGLIYLIPVFILIVKNNFSILSFQDYEIILSNLYELVKNPIEIYNISELIMLCHVKFKKQGILERIDIKLSCHLLNVMRNYLYELTILLKDQKENHYYSNLEYKSTIYRTFTLLFHLLYSQIKTVDGKSLLYLEMILIFCDRNNVNLLILLFKNPLILDDLSCQFLVKGLRHLKKISFKPFQLIGMHYEKHPQLSKTIILESEILFDLPDQINEFLLESPSMSALLNMDDLCDCLKMLICLVELILKEYKNQVVIFIPPLLDCFVKFSKRILNMNNDNIQQGSDKKQDSNQVIENDIKMLNGMIAIIQFLSRLLYKSLEKLFIPSITGAILKNMEFIIILRDIISKLETVLDSGSSSFPPTLFTFNINNLDNSNNGKFKQQYNDSRKPFLGHVCNLIVLMMDIEGFKNICNILSINQNNVIKILNFMK